VCWQPTAVALVLWHLYYSHHTGCWLLATLATLGTPATRLLTTLATDYTGYTGYSLHWLLTTLAIATHYTLATHYTHATLAKWNRGGIEPKTTLSLGQLLTTMLLSGQPQVTGEFGLPISSTLMIEQLHNEPISAQGRKDASSCRWEKRRREGCRFDQNKVARSSASHQSNVSSLFWSSLSLHRHHCKICALSYSFYSVAHTALSYSQSATLLHSVLHSSLPSPLHSVATTVCFNYPYCSNFLD